MRTFFIRAKNNINGSQTYGPLKGKGLGDGERTLLKYTFLFMDFSGQEIVGKEKQ